MLSVVSCTNGNFKIEAEGLSEQGAKVKYHQVCAAFWNAPDVLLAQVAIKNEQLETVGGYSEQITHSVPEPQEQGE